MISSPHNENVDTFYQSDEQILPNRLEIWTYYTNQCNVLGVF